MLRAAEDKVFRTKLSRDADAAVRAYGYRLSDAALAALAALDFEDAAADDAPPRLH